MLGRATIRYGAPQRKHSWSPGFLRITVNTIKLETGFRPNSAGIPQTFLIEVIGFPTVGLLL